MSRESDRSEPHAERMTLLSRKTLTPCLLFPKNLRHRVRPPRSILVESPAECHARAWPRRVAKNPAIPQLHQHHGIYGGIQPQYPPNLRRQSDGPSLGNRNRSHTAILQCDINTVKCQFSPRGELKKTLGKFHMISRNLTSKSELALLKPLCSLCPRWSNPSQFINYYLQKFHF